jgi:hypothetical protein
LGGQDSPPPPLGEWHLPFGEQNVQQLFQLFSLATSDCNAAIFVSSLTLILFGQSYFGIYLLIQESVFHFQKKKNLETHGD